MCFFCKGKMENGFTTYTIDIGKSIVVVRNVPCEKCSQCGETVFSGTTVRELEKIVEEMGKSFTEIAVVTYADKVA